MGRYWALFCLLGLFSCDPVKRAIKRQEKVDAIIADYLSRNPPRGDTLYISGDTVYHTDTIVNENIYIDTVKVNDTIYVHQTRWRDIIQTVRVVDTIIHRINLDHTNKAISKENAVLKDKLDSVVAKKNQFLIALIIVSSLFFLYIAYLLFK